MRRLGARLFGAVHRRASGPYVLATEDDLYYCYRLLLHREPDEAGWRYWKEQIDQSRISLKSLTTSFLTSEDFLRTQLHTGYAELNMAAQQLQLVDLDSFQLYIQKGDPLGESIAQSRSYEPHVVQVLRQLLKAGDVFIDIGANLGYLSLLAATIVGPEGHVIAFEPNPRNGLLIRASITQNGLRNIDLRINAVAEQEQTFILEVAGSNGRVLAFGGGGSPERPADAPFPHCYLVQAVALDHALADAPRIDLIKLDIEGAEPGALRGMTQLVRRHRPAIITEFFPSMLMSTSATEPETYLDELRRHAYVLHIIEPTGISATARSNREILDALAQSPPDHLDLLALPERR